MNARAMLAASAVALASAVAISHAPPALPSATRPARACASGVDAPRYCDFCQRPTDVGLPSSPFVVSVSWLPLTS